MSDTPACTPGSATEHLVRTLVAKNYGSSLILSLIHI